MIKEEKIRKELENLEGYILGDSGLDKLDSQLIDVINSERELMSQKVRRILKWVLGESK